jgi:hypothetical protein
MSMTDDIRGETPSSQTERVIRRDEGEPNRSIGPESETRGGPEAIDETLDDKPGDSAR